MNGTHRVTRLSKSTSNPTQAIAVFAHNEAGRIRLALESILAAAGHAEIDVYVLANGCTDATVKEVYASASLVPGLWLVETDVADKANAWNVYVHDIFTAERAHQFDTFFFMDGDVTLAPQALALLAAALAQVPSAEAAGGMPATGRDRDAWRQRMTANGMLAGNCYALREGFVQRLRDAKVRMPVGLIGEDFFVSWLVASNAWREQAQAAPGPRCVFCSNAEFAFVSLSPLRPADYRTYINRKWRYTLRALQHQMLLLLLVHQGLDALPRDIDELYRRAPLPSRLQWVGVDSLLRLLAVLWIRRRRARAPAANAG